MILWKTDRLSHWQGLQLVWKVDPWDVAFESMCLTFAAVDVFGAVLGFLIFTGRINL